MTKNSPQTKKKLQLDKKDIIKKQNKTKLLMTSIRLNGKVINAFCLRR